MSKMDKLKEIIRELIRNELEEATTTGDIAGYDTPNAFTGGSGKGKKKKKEISTNSTGYNVVKEALNETPQMAKQGQVGLLLKLANKQLQDVFSLHKKGKNKEAKVVFNNKVYSTLEYIHRAFDNVSESVNEGKYHDYRNDDTMTPKQKIGRSMREVRDGLNNLEKLVKMNVRLKNELNVNKTSK